MNGLAKNLWILTEERPKTNVLRMIFEYFSRDQGCGFFGDHIRIIPILNENKCFAFTYEVIGFTCARVKRVFIKTVSGSSSFTDFLIYYQDAVPRASEAPIYVIEETKTDDSESRNTGVFQRCSKFVFIENYYPTAKKIMLYALQVQQKKKTSDTNVFGTRLLLTLGVEILGKETDDNVLRPFTSVDEVIRCKNSMRRPPADNVPILIYKTDEKIQISGRLFKSGGLAHDPNIEALSIISAVLRKLGWNKKIEIIEHGLEQSHVGKTNKFVLIANKIGIELEGLTIPQVSPPKEYWRYDRAGEKLGTIFIHIVVENFTNGYSVFENHAGCEKGYFRTSAGEHIPLAKYTDKKAYKAGDKSRIVFIPDLVLLDVDEKVAITIEGKTYENKNRGIAELNNYEAFDTMYLRKYYSQYKIVRTVVLYGGLSMGVFDMEVGFLLNENGKLVLGIKAPKLFTKAIRNLLDYWW